MIFSKRKSKSDDGSNDAKALIDALNKIQALIWFKPDGTILDANQNFLAVSGYSLDEIKGQHHKLFLLDEDSNCPEYEKFWEDLAGGETKSGKFFRITKSGDPIWIEASYNPIFGADGNVDKIVKFAIDVTEARMQAIDSNEQLNAISRSQAVIEFDLDGTILTANDNFLNTLGYSLSEIKGQHHRMFLCDQDVASQDYQEFWPSLKAGNFKSGEFMRVTKTGEQIWIQASYNPIFDAKGRPFKVVKFASDVTQQKMQAADFEGQLSAISKSQAVIEFDMNGIILSANDNFLSAMGYTLDEVQGQHHRIFIPKDDADKPAYAQFWKDLSDGTFASDEFKRISKSGEEIWIQASYNPIFDPTGKPYKVVKYATDVTPRKVALADLSNGLSALASGDLSIRLKDCGSADFEEIYASFNKTLVRLEELVEGILETSESIAGETECIAGVASDLAVRTEKQAASVEETSSAIDEISSTIQSTARNAEAATDAAHSASRNAQSGTGIVTEAISAMQSIEESASKIGQVVEVIDGIAFQTNLLALNAGVEAARAGEAGSGFAVVASEVRALAQKAAESARQINELIQASNTEVEQGAVLVGNSGTALEKIERGVGDVVTNINDIQKASQEQALGIAEVTNAVVEIDSTIQKTAALAEESSAAATLLADKAVTLRELVSYFNVTRSKAQSRDSQPPQASPPPQTATVQQVAVNSDAEVVEDQSAYDESGWNDF